MIKTAFERLLAAVTLGALTAAVVLLLLGARDARGSHLLDEPYIPFDTGMSCTTLEDMKELIDVKPADGWFLLAQLRLMQGRCFGKFTSGPAGVMPILFRVYYDKVVEQYIYEGEAGQAVTLVQVHDQFGKVAFSWQRGTVTDFHRKLPEWTIPGQET